ncbi:DUF3265 domain-containing protein, partial [Vibrio vulnificus]
SFGGEVGLRKLALCGIHPLTQRYVYKRIKICLIWMKLSL